MPIIDTLEQLEDIRESIVDCNKISKIIHQTWKTKDIPEHWTSSYNGWIRCHPDYYYVLWTDEMNLQLVERFYPHFLEKYTRFPYNIQRADAVRTFYLHRYGGIYSDLDLEPLKRIDLYLDNRYEIILLQDIGGLGKYKKFVMNRGDTLKNIFRNIEKNGRYTNMLMASKPMSPFWDRVVYRMNNPIIPWWAGSYHFYVMCTTGPFVIDKEAKRYNQEKIGLFPYEYFQPCTVCDEKPCSTEDAYMKMLTGSSWANLNSRIITLCACNWNLLAVAIFLFIIAVVIWFFLILRPSHRY